MGKETWKNRLTRHPGKSIELSKKKDLSLKSTATLSQNKIPVFLMISIYAAVIDPSVIDIKSRT